MVQEITGSACRKWGARRFRISLRDKGLGGRRRTEQKEPSSRTKQEEPRKKSPKEEPNKEKPPASIEGKMRVAGERFFAYAQNDSLVGR